MVAKSFMSPKYAAIVVNADTQKILYSQSALEPRHPASLTKIMTLYIVFDAIKGGKLNPMKPIAISTKAAKQPRSNLALKAGTIITVRDAIMGAIIKSGNDATVALAEVLAGSEENFVKIMNRKAKELGMMNTVFQNSTGLPHPRQVTTAKDMAILALSMLKHHKSTYHVFSKQAFLLGEKMVLTHNKLLASHKWVDGMKTGFTNASGYNVITTAIKDDVRLIGVVMGCNSSSERDSKMLKLLESHYATGAKNIVGDLIFAKKQQISITNKSNIDRKDPFSVISIASASSSK
ncbi:D-alanyl-D-alanine carboxypeptidase DacF precursor [Candidatus Cyrtobacter comes]|uniref:D-alanyl-D-alanine carboxypeptidase DacF n=2 Tax=Candidatus Cyrtobacter comes TaxID=675776 RepID=A0ABU5L6E3_9RICK|nr:D-alanyl-D-alanine carboxypeptidase DacF precursor [Candidatus Cyrtobacter comes]